MQTAGQPGGAPGLRVVPGERSKARSRSAVGRGGPGLVPLPSGVHNLPRPLSSFVGRRPEIEAVGELVRASPLVTVTGPSGMGKTRLAIQVATEMASTWADGVCMVELAVTPATADPALVAEAAASALGVRAEPGRSFTEALAGRLRHTSFLLVLDNCEHVAAAAGVVVAELLGACHGVSVLATSQRPLGVAGEQVWPLAPLSLPGPERVGAGSDAVALFHSRAQEVNAGFVVTEEGAAAVAEICRRLDGIPLAIELAAARTAVLSPPEIAEHLDRRFSVLVRRTAAATPRHQTLRSALDWSWGLLSPAEQALLRRLSVFVGGAVLVDVRAVCTGGEVGREAVVDLLEGLVSSSLVVADTARSRARYHLLESVCAYAKEQLEAAGEADAVAERHALVFADFAEQGWHQVVAGPPSAADALEAEHDNLRAALGWLLDHKEAGIALALGSALAPFWRGRGHFREGRDWLERALAAALDAPADLRVRGLWGVGILAVMQGELERAAGPLEEALVLARAHGLDRATMQVLNLLGFMSVFTRDPVAALPLLEESVALARAKRHPDSLMTALALCGRAHLFSGSTAAARTAFEECLEVGRAGGDESEGLIGLGWVALSCGQHEQAAGLLGRALPLVRNGGAPFETALVLSFLGELAWRRGDDAEAKALLDEGLTLSRDMGVPFPLARNLLGLGRVAQVADDVEAASGLVDEAVAVARRAQLGHVLVRCLLALAELHRAGGHLAQARACMDEALILAIAKGDRGGMADARRALGTLARVAGDYLQATNHHLDALDLHLTVGDVGGLADDLQGLAGVVLAQDRAEHAARLLGAAGSVRRSSGGWASPLDRRDLDADVALLQASLPGPDLDRALSEGEALSLDEALAFAARSRGGRKRPATGRAALTPAESQVVDLVAEGLTNNEVADRMFISSRTVQGHLRKAFQKLGVNSRRELRNDSRKP